MPTDTTPQCMVGDLNQDGIINVIDIISLVNYILGEPVDENGECASDINADGILNVIDIVSLVNLILSF